MVETNRSVLSTRERQILKLASAGLTDTAICTRLEISASTVKTYWRRIRSKLGCSSRTELVATVLKSEIEKATTSLRSKDLGDVAEAKAQCDYFKLLIEHAPDAMLILDHDGIIRVLNQSVTDLFGWDERDLLGHNVSCIVPERFRGKHTHFMQDYIATPTKHAMADHLETFGLHRSGIEIPIAANLSSIQMGEEVSIICVVRILHLPK